MQPPADSSRRPSRLLAALAVFAGVFVASEPAFASPEDVLGFGPRGVAMGGTGTAHAIGYEAAYANPALLSMIRERRLVLGYQATSFALSHGGGADWPAYDAARGIAVGADVPLPFRGALRDRVGLGIAFYTPENLVARARLLFPETEQYPLLPDRTQSIMIRAGLGLDVGYGIRVGGGFAALAELAGKVLVATDATGRVGSRVETQLVASYAPAFGASYDIHKRFRIGASYRGELAARFDVTVDATKLSTLNLPVFTIGGLAQYDPEQAALEVAYTGDRDIVALGATFKRWSKLDGLIEPTVRCPPDNSRCGALTPPSIDYSDTVVLHAGAEHAIPLSKTAVVKARAGLRFEPSPLPSKVPTSKAYDRSVDDAVDVPTRYLDAARVAPSLGMGIRFHAFTVPLDLDWFGTVHFLVPRTLSSGASEGRAAGRVLATGLFLGVTL